MEFTKEELKAAKNVSYRVGIPANREDLEAGLLLWLVENYKIVKKNRPKGLSYLYTCLTNRAYEITNAENNKALGKYCHQNQAEYIEHFNLHKRIVVNYLKAHDNNYVKQYVSDKPSRNIIANRYFIENHSISSIAAEVNRSPRTINRTVRHIILYMLNNEYLQNE